MGREGKLAPLASGRSDDLIWQALRQGQQCPRNRELRSALPSTATAAELTWPHFGSFRLVSNIHTCGAAGGWAIQSHSWLQFSRWSILE